MFMSKQRICLGNFPICCFLRDNCPMIEHLAMLLLHAMPAVQLLTWLLGSLKLWTKNSFLTFQCWNIYLMFMFISGHASVEIIHTQVNNTVITIKRPAASFLLTEFLSQLKTPQIFSVFLSSILYVVILFEEKFSP